MQLRGGGAAGGRSDDSRFNVLPMSPSSLSLGSSPKMGSLAPPHLSFLPCLLALYCCTAASQVPNYGTPTATNVLVEVTTPFGLSAENIPVIFP